MGIRGKYDYPLLNEENKPESPGSLAVEGTPVTEPKRGIVTGQLVNVRDAPEPNARVLTLVQCGTKVDILDHEGTWLKIKVDGSKIDGYIVSDFVSEV